MNKDQVNERYTNKEFIEEQIKSFKWENNIETFRTQLEDIFDNILMIARNLHLQEKRNFDSTHTLGMNQLNENSGKPG